MIPPISKVYNQDNKAIKHYPDNHFDLVFIDAPYGIDAPNMTMGALSKKGGAGIGFTLGIFVSFMCLAVDNLIRTWANERKKLLGIE